MIQGPKSLENNRILTFLLTVKMWETTFQCRSGLDQDKSTSWLHFGASRQWCGLVQGRRQPPSSPRSPQIFQLTPRRAELGPGLAADPGCGIYYLASVRCCSPMIELLPLHDPSLSARARACAHARRCRDQRPQFRSLESSSVSPELMS